MWRATGIRKWPQTLIRLYVYIYMAKSENSGSFLLSKMDLFFFLDLFEKENNTWQGRPYLIADVAHRTSRYPEEKSRLILPSKVDPCLI